LRQAMKPALTCASRADGFYDGVRREDEEADVTDATERLRAVQASRSSRVLIESLDDPSPDVARAAIRRIEQIEGPGAADALRARLLSADLSLIADIAKALRRIGDTGAVDLAIAGLTGEPYTRRLAAARALGAFADARAAFMLRSVLHDAVAGVRVAALDALAEIGRATDEACACARLLGDPSPQVRIAAVRAVARIAGQPGNLLSPLAQDPDRGVRLKVAQHVATLPDPPARLLLNDPDLRVREAAARASGMRQVGALAVLLIDDPGVDVRRAAATALGGLGDTRIAEVLVPGIEDPDAVVRAAVLRALVQLVMRGGAVRRLRHELGSSRPERRRASVYALAHLEALEAAEDVMHLLYDADPDVRLALIHTAGSLVPDPESLVRSLAEDRDAAVRGSAEVWLLRALRERSSRAGRRCRARDPRDHHRRAAP
jgi:HEAT repeat protein